MTVIDVSRIWVPGVPIPQGSKTQRRLATGRTIMFEANPGLKPWRATVAKKAADVLADRTARGTGPYDGPLYMHMVFGHPMPKSRSAVDRKRGWRWRDTTPDIEKLVRAVHDALDTDARLLVNDSRVAQLHVYQREITDPAMVGAEIVIGRLTYPTS